MTDEPRPTEDDPETTSPRPGRPLGRSVGSTIGGILAGVDGQVFRSTPPAAELVQKARPVRGLSGEDGTLLSIELPGDEDPLPPR